MGIAGYGVLLFLLLLLLHYLTSLSLSPFPYGQLRSGEKKM